MAEAFENALKKVPLTDYRAVYPGHDYRFHIEVNNGIPLFEEYDWDGNENFLNIARKRKPKWNFKWGK